MRCQLECEDGGYLVLFGMFLRGGKKGGGWGGVGGEKTISGRVLCNRVIDSYSSL